MLIKPHRTGVAAENLQGSSPSPWAPAPAKEKHPAGSDVVYYR